MGGLRRRTAPAEGFDEAREEKGKGKTHRTGGANGRGESSFVNFVEETPASTEEGAIFMAQ